MLRTITTLLIVAFLIGCTRHGEPPKMVDGQVQFTLHNSEANQIFVVGSFNGWNQTINLMTNHGKGVFIAKIPLPIGFHTYHFQIDDKGWRTDPSNPATVTTTDGGTNSVLYVNEQGKVELRAPANGDLTK